MFVMHGWSREALEALDLADLSEERERAIALWNRVNGPKDE
ncbi:MAG: hypothetical protein Q8R97_06320 [Brevundimonas sp.]|jgi:hypothetical protein|nr:hypothetical protein [Brevundimonas sp.]MDP3400719.1 hypothetical protein [Brevundimonas sp.]MDZ4108146.1 hypothetical protein [Brevundimonas sp.]